MPYSRRTGKRYAAGSQATWSEGDSRVCCHCGKTLRITVDSVWIHYDRASDTHRSSHTGCGSPLRPVEALNGD